jgi:hypothetical protein
MVSERGNGIRTCWESEYLSVSSVLTSLGIGGNNLNEEAALGIVRAVREQGKMKMLGLAASVRPGRGRSPTTCACQRRR